MTDEKLLTPEEVADMFQVPVATIYRWNSNRTGPRYYRIGRHVRYRRSDLITWLEQQAKDGEVQL